MVAGSDVALTWLPPDFGNREWEFGTVSASFNALVSVTFGLALVLLGLASAGMKWPLRVLSMGFALLALLVAAAAVLYWTNIPLALDAVPDGTPLRTGILKAMAKTSLQGIVFPLAHGTLAVIAWRWSGRSGWS